MNDNSQVFQILVGKMTVSCYIQKLHNIVLRSNKKKGHIFIKMYLKRPIKIDIHYFIILFVILRKAIQIINMQIDVNDVSFTYTCNLFQYTHDMHVCKIFLNTIYYIFFLINHIHIFFSFMLVSLFLSHFYSKRIVNIIIAFTHTKGAQLQKDIIFKLILL